MCCMTTYVRQAALACCGLVSGSCGLAHVGCTRADCMLGLSAGITRGCWMSTVLPRRALRSCTLMISTPSPCQCSSAPSSPSTWLSTGACPSTMAPGSSWLWLWASSLVPSSGGWVTNCEFSSFACAATCPPAEGL